MNVMFRGRKVPWAPLAVMAFKVLLVFLVRLVLKVPLERTVTRWSKDWIHWDTSNPLSINLRESVMFKTKACTAGGER